MEALGILGFSLSVLSFFTNQLPTLLRRERDVRECNQQLRKHRSRLQICNIALDRWDKKWWRYHHNAAYVHEDMWGVEQVMEVREKLAMIRWQCDTVCEEVRLHTRTQSGQEENNLNQPVTRWVGLSQAANPRNYTDADLSLLRRIGYSFLHSERLGDKIQDLNQSISDLALVSEHAFREMGHAGQEEVITDETVSRCKKKIQLSRFSSALCRKCKRKCRDYEMTLHLRLPDAFGNDNMLETLLDEAYIELSLRFQVRRAGGVKEPRETHLTFQMIEFAAIGVRDFSQLKLSDLALLLTPVPVEFEGIFYLIKRESIPARRLRCIREKMSALPLTEQDPNSWLEYRIEAARILLATTLWVILAWESEWFLRACACRIYCAPLNNEEQRPWMASQHWRQYVYQPWIPLETLHTCCKFNESDEEPSRLGTLFGELLLGEPVHIISRMETPFFVVGMGSSKRSMSDDQLIQAIRAEVPARMTNVVRYCLNNTAICRDETTKNPSLIKENVLAPVWDYYNKIIDYVEQRNVIRLRLGPSSVS